MHVLSINVSQPVSALYKRKKVVSGIYKRPLLQPVVARKNNIDGDGQADLTNHGGEDKAVYAFPFEHYAYYQDALSQERFEYGEFGENLTTRGILETAVHIGDQFRLGEAIFEVSQPRTPCFKLAMKLHTPDVVRLMLDSGKTGFYLRVVKEGVIKPGKLYPEAIDPSEPSVEEIHKLMFFDIANAERLKKASANCALGQSVRREFSSRLRKLTE